VGFNEAIKPHLVRCADDLHPLRAQALLAAIPDDALVSGGVGGLGVPGLGGLGPLRWTLQGSSRALQWGLLRFCQISSFRFVAQTKPKPAATP